MSLFSNRRRLIQRRSSRIRNKPVFLTTLNKLSRHIHKSSIDLKGTFSTSFKKLQSIQPSFLNPLLLTHLRIFYISFISNQNFHSLIFSNFLNFIQPHIYMFKGFPISFIINNKNSISPSIISSSNSSKPFLSSRIPLNNTYNLQFGRSILYSQSSKLKIHSNSSNKVF